MEDHSSARNKRRNVKPIRISPLPNASAEYVYYEKEYENFPEVGARFEDNELCEDPVRVVEEEVEEDIREKAKVDVSDEENEACEDRVRFVRYFKGTRLYLYIGVDLRWLKVKEEDDYQEMSRDAFVGKYRASWKSKGYVFLDRDKTVIQEIERPSASSNVGASRTRAFTISNKEDGNVLTFECGPDETETLILSLQDRLKPWRSLISSGSPSDNDVKGLVDVLADNMQNDGVGVSAQAMVETISRAATDKEIILRGAAYMIEHVAHLRALFDEAEKSWRVVERSTKYRGWPPLVDEALKIVAKVVDLCSRLLQRTGGTEESSMQGLIALFRNLESLLRSLENLNFQCSVEQFKTSFWKHEGPTELIVKVEDISRAFNECQEDRTNEIILDLLVTLEAGLVYWERVKPHDAYTSKSSDSWRASFISVPPLSARPTVRFGDQSCREGKVLNELLMRGDDSGILDVGITLSVMGKAGLGKTTSLKAVANHPRIRRQYRGGVYWLQIQTCRFIEQIAYAIRLSGGHDKSNKVLQLTTMEEATSEAVDWFDKKRCLFIVDDAYALVFLKSLQKIAGSTSSLLFSTRNASLANLCGAQSINFDVLSPLETRAQCILLDGVTIAGAGLNESETNAVKRVLAKCAGFPLALDIAAQFIKSSSWSWATYENLLLAKSLETSRFANGTKYPEVLRWVIAVALSYLDGEPDERQCIDALMSHSFEELFLALSVIPRNTRAPISVLARLWELGTDNICIASGIARTFENVGLLKVVRSDELGEIDNKEDALEAEISDVILEMCREGCRTSETETGRFHVQLLNYFWSEVQKSAEVETPLKEQGWWCLQPRKDTYMLNNVIRHLVCGERQQEALSLVIDYRWWTYRIEVGIMARLMDDYYVLMNSLEQEENPEYADMKDDLRLIREVFRNVCVNNSKNVGMLPLQLCIRLVPWIERPLIRQFLQSMDKHAEKSWVRSASQYLAGQEFHGELHLVTTLTKDVAMSDNGMIVAMCGEEYGKGVVRMLDICTGLYICESEDSSCAATSVAVSENGGHLISGWSDGTVRYWIADCGTSLLTLSKPGRAITTAAINGSGTRAVSAGDGGIIRIWNTSEDLLLREINTAHSFGIAKLFMTADGEKIVAGSRLGHISVIDSSGNVVAQRLEALEYNLSYLSISADGRFVVFPDERCRVRACTRLWDTLGDTLYTYCAEVSGNGICALSGDGKHLVQVFNSWSKPQVVLFEKYDIVEGHAPGLAGANKMMLQQPLEGSNKPALFITSLVVSKDGSRVLYSLQDGSVRLWNFESRALGA